MRCTRCQNNDAVFVFTRLEPGSTRAEREQLCQECASSASPYIRKLFIKQPVAELLEQLLKAQTKEEGAATVPQSARATPQVPPCSHCGLSFGAYKASLMLGCAKCYASFGEALLEDIRRFHNTDHHVGDAPPQRDELVDRQVRLSAMRQELQDCIENEDFERAAYLRDQIRKLTEDGVPDAKSSENVEESPRG